MLQLEEVGMHDPQVAVMFLHSCSGFCKLANLSRVTPPSFSSSMAFELIDSDVWNGLTQSTSVDMMDPHGNRLN